jgi:LysR family glycine cleavage system transcriptional activator
MSCRVPSLFALEAFVTAARLRSFQEAADRMAISVSAFSRRIQQIEDALGVTLLERSQSGVRLTADGAAYLAEIEPALATLRRATRSLCKPADRDTLRLATSQSFATQWLIPRLAAATAATGARIELVCSRDPHLLSRGDVDLAIWGGLDEPAGGEPLFEAEAVAVASAERSARPLVLRSIDEIAGHRLLSVESPADMWERWLTAAGYGRAMPRGTQFDTLQHVYDAAGAGLGIGLAIPLVFEPHLGNRRMRACMPVRIGLNTGYRLYYADAASSSRRTVVRFREWLQTAIDHSVQLFDRWWDEQRSQLQ